jgi:phenylacetate-CoA ligase
MRFKKFKSWIIENLLLQPGDWILGTSMIKQLKKQRKLAFLDANQLRELQLEKLKSILTHAASTCEAYKNISPLESNILEWLNSFPVITKKNITLNGLKYVSSKYNIEDLIRYESSGSTGQRSVIYIDKEEQSLLRAILILWWEWNGYYFGKPILQTGMSPDRGIVKRVKDFLLSTHYMVAFDLSEEEIIKTLNKVSHIKNMNLFGYASSLYVIAKVAKNHGLSNKFDLTMSQGDKMFDHYKSEISSSFDCNVVEDYGLNEGFMVGQKVD